MSNEKQYLMNYKWTEQATRELIHIWKEYYLQLIGNRKNTIIYSKMAEKLSETLKLEVPLHKSLVQTKINNLRKFFKYVLVLLKCHNFNLELE